MDKSPDLCIRALMTSFVLFNQTCCDIISIISMFHLQYVISVSFASWRDVLNIAASPDTSFRLLESPAEVPEWLNIHRRVAWSSSTWPWPAGLQQLPQFLMEKNERSDMCFLLFHYLAVFCPFLLVFNS